MLKTRGVSYYGFPPEYYKVQYPNRGDPELASKILGLLRDVGIEAKGVLNLCDLVSGKDKNATSILNGHIRSYNAKFCG